MGSLIVASYFAVAEKSLEYLGATSEVAGFLTFFIGIMVYHNEISLSVIVAIIITIILYARSMLHHFAQRIKKGEFCYFFESFEFILYNLKHVWLGAL